MIKRFWPVVALIICLISGCSKDDEFMFDINHLTNTPWGIPQIIEPGMGHIDMDAPTIFDPSGFVTIGNSRNDLWTVRGKRSIFIEQARETWFIIRLTADQLYVEKTSFPDGTFIVKCIYEPLKK
jgi:hypothetical protein